MFGWWLLALLLATIGFVVFQLRGVGLGNIRSLSNHVNSRASAPIAFYTNLAAYVIVLLAAVTPIVIALTIAIGRGRVGMLIEMMNRGL
jgi:predicted anti-sigma-YlaC factor YlaD